MASTGGLNVTHEDEEHGGELDFRIRRRDRYSIELKFRHLLDPDRKRFPRRRTTRIRLVFFLPYSFNIRPDTLEPERFYDDVKLYVRFNTPSLSVDELLDPNSRDSPLARICRMLDEPTTVKPEAVRYEAKLLGAITKSVLRDSLGTLLQGKDEISQREIDTFCEIVGRLHDAFSRYRWVLSTDELPPVTLTDLQLIDEDVSLAMDNYLVHLLTDARIKRSEVSTKTVRRALYTQQEYRREQGYASVVSHDSGTRKREEYIYRYKMLKRFASSVLFFDIHRGNQAKRVEHLLYAFAAGLAMAIATGISFIGQIRFGTLSSTLFIVLVGAYMIKDRIKDAFRSGFQRTLGKLFYDRRTVFKDQSTRKAMGVVKERTMFVNPRRLDERLLRARARGGFETAIMNTNPESVLEYTKLLRLRERRLHRIHRRITGLADINIVDVKNLLRYLVRQREQVPVIKNGTVKLEESRRIYHLNVLVAADIGQGEHWHKVRLVVDAGGIRRIEQPGKDEE